MVHEASKQMDRLISYWRFHIALALKGRSEKESPTVIMPAVACPSLQFLNSLLLSKAA